MSDYDQAIRCPRCGVIYGCAPCYKRHRDTCTHRPPLGATAPTNRHTQEDK